MDWNYHENGGPEGWGRLTLPGSNELAFPDCNGDRQSPIAIPPGAPVSTDAIALNYRATKLRVTNTGLLLQVDYEDGSSLTADGETYALQQFHFHMPGEHEVDGSFSAIEVHFVHQSAEGVRAVVGVLMDPGEANPTFGQVLDATPETPGTVERDATIEPWGLLPSDLSCYVYEGSLTMPPCSEGVQWHVVRQRITASGEQIARFRALPFLNPEGAFVGNTRPVQPLNGRFE